MPCASKRDPLFQPVRDASINFALASGARVIVAMGLSVQDEYLKSAQLDSRSAAQHLLGDPGLTFYTARIADGTPAPLGQKGGRRRLITVHSFVPLPVGEPLSKPWSKRCSLRAARNFALFVRFAHKSIFFKLSTSAPLIAERQASCAT